MAFLISVCIGGMLGFLSGLGVGGGSLLVLWLGKAAGMEPDQIRLVNLLFFLPCAAGASFIRLRKKALPFRKILPLLALGCGGAIAGCIVSGFLPVDLLKKIFGVLLLYTGGLEFKKGIQRLRKAR